MPEETQIPPQGGTFHVKNVRMVDAPPVPEVYANHVIPQITSYEVTLHFGTILEISSNEAKVARRVSIVLTPEVAKLLVLQLSIGLANYEKSVRPISTQGQVVQQSANPLSAE